MPADLVSLAAGLLAVFLVLLAHELGHVLVGRTGGFRFSLLIVGPLHVQRGTDGRLYWRLNKRLGLAGGIAASVPERLDGLRTAFLRFTAGGPLTSLALGVTTLAIYVGAGFADGGPATPVPGQEALALGLFTVAAGSIAIGFATLIPINVAGFVNDGVRILQLWRPGPPADRHAAVMALGSCFIAGRRPREWDPALVRSAVSMPDGSYDDALGHYMAYFHALDRADPQAAETHVRAMVELADGVPDAFRPVIELESAYFDAAYGRDAGAGSDGLARIGKSPLVEEHARCRAEAAVLLVEGAIEVARAKLDATYDHMARNEALDESAFVMAEIERLCRSWGLPQPEPAPVDASPAWQSRS